MITCRCPHCQTQICDDGRLAGQVVTCSACHQPFQMPVIKPPPLSGRPVNSTDDALGNLVIRTTPSGVSSRRRKTNRLPVVVTGLVLLGFVLSATVLVGTGTISISLNKAKKFNGTTSVSTPDNGSLTASKNPEISGGALPSPKPDEEARKALQLAFDSWILQESIDEFEKAHPNISPTIRMAVRAEVLLRYEITAHRYDEQERVHRFALNLTFQARSGGEFKESYVVMMRKKDNGSWVIF